MKHHLAKDHIDSKPCDKVSNEVRDFFISLLKKNDGDVVELDEELNAKEKLMKGAHGKTKTPHTLNTIYKKATRDDVCMLICEFMYANAIPFSTVYSIYFPKMVNGIAEFGKGLKPPSYHEVRVTFLKKEVEKLNVSLDAYKLEWKKIGCTLMSDGWTDAKGRSITNFLVNSPRGTVFLKSEDTSDIIHSGENLFELLDGVIEEIGEQNVIQMVSDGASAYVKAGELLMAKRPNLFRSPCIAHCIDLILHDIGDFPMHKDTVEKARTVSTYIYRHGWVLSLMRKYTGGRELIRSGVTRFATNYLNLRSLQVNKIGLREMFASEAWQRSSYAKKSDGIRAQEIILGSEIFWSSIISCLKSVIPLVKVLRFVDGDDKPAMGYIYEAIDKAKESIKANFKNVKKRYADYWKIIDDRWDKQLHGHLHVARCYLNPRYQYDPNFNAHFEIKQGLYDTIRRLCPTREERIKIDMQLDIFRRAEKMFGHDMAIETRTRKQPALWWESYGDSCPELQRIAIRIQSATCSATGCERNWSTFEQVHSKRRNRLEQQRWNALVFVKYNLKLEERHIKRQEKGDSYDPICLSDMEFDDEWITEKEDPVLPLDTLWMDVQECFNVPEFDQSQNKRKRKRGPRDLRKKSLCRSGKRKEGTQEDNIVSGGEEEVEEVVEVEEDEQEIMRDEDIERASDHEVDLLY